jgi:hypothetical protein
LARVHVHELPESEGGSRHSKQHERRSPVYLLLSVHLVDAIPLSLYRTRDHAMAERTNWKPSDATNSMFLSFELVKFRDGKPIAEEYFDTQESTDGFGPCVVRQVEGVM